MAARRELALRFASGDVVAPASMEAARLLPTLVRSGRAMSLRTGVVHLVEDAAIATEGAVATLVTRWRCGGGSVNALPADVDERLVGCANCKEAAKYPTGPAVYRCYDADDELLYISSTVSVYQRIKGHRSATAWWDEVARIDAQGFPTISAARLAESVAIRAEAPAYNRECNTLILEPSTEAAS